MSSNLEIRQGLSHPRARPTTLGQSVWSTCSGSCWALKGRSWHAFETEPRCSRSIDRRIPHVALPLTNPRLEAFLGVPNARLCMTRSPIFDLQLLVLEINPIEALLSGRFCQCADVARDVHDRFRPPFDRGFAKIALILAFVSSGPSLLARSRHGVPTNKV